MQAKRVVVVAGCGLLIAALSACIPLRPPASSLPFAVRSDSNGSLELMFCSPTEVESITGSARPLSGGEWLPFLEITGPAELEMGEVLSMDDLGNELVAELNERIDLPSEVELSITRTGGASYYLSVPVDEGIQDRGAWALSTGEVVGADPCGER